MEQKLINAEHVRNCGILVYEIVGLSTFHLIAGLICT